MDHIAVYPGSFDPITNGHVDIIERASKLFDTVYVLISLNIQKTHLFNKEERITLVKESLKHIDNVIVDTSDGFVFEYAKSNNIQYNKEKERFYEKIDFTFTCFYIGFYLVWLRSKQNKIIR